jgi:hypothetical protein
MSKRWKSLRTGKPKLHSFLKRNGGEREVAGLELLGDRSVVVFREGGCR